MTNSFDISYFIALICGGYANKLQQWHWLAFNYMATESNDGKLAELSIKDTSSILLKKNAVFEIRGTISTQETHLEMARREGEGWKQTFELPAERHRFIVFLRNYSELFARHSTLQYNWCIILYCTHIFVCFNYSNWSMILTRLFSRNSFWIFSGCGRNVCFMCTKQHVLFTIAVIDVYIVSIVIMYEFMDRFAIVNILVTCNATYD